MGEQPGIGEAASRAAVGHGLILYDVDCGFCRWSVAKVLAWDRRAKLGVLPIQSPEGARILAALDRPAQLASWHFLTSPTAMSAPAARSSAPVLRLLPGGTALAALVNRRLARFWALNAFLMHWGIFFVMGIRFRYQLSGLLYAPFLEPERALQGLVGR